MLLTENLRTQIIKQWKNAVANPNNNLSECLMGVKLLNFPIGSPPLVIKKGNDAKRW